MTQEENDRLNKALDEIEKARIDSEKIKEELEQVRKRDGFISFVIIFTLSFLGSSLVTYFITK